MKRFLEHAKEDARLIGNFVFRTPGLKFGVVAAVAEKENLNPASPDYNGNLTALGSLVFGFVRGTAAQLIAPGTTAILEHRLQERSPLHEWSRSREGTRALGYQSAADALNIFSTIGVAVLANIAGHPEAAFPAAVLLKTTLNAVTNAQIGLQEFGVIQENNSQAN